MVGFNVGDNRHHRLQMQERRIALIGFRYQVAAMAQTRMHARRLHQATVDESRVQTRFRINACDHRGGCGFTVCPGNGDAMTKTHQLRQHFRAANNRDTRLVCGNDFRVIGRDSR